MTLVGASLLFVRLVRLQRGLRHSSRATTGLAFFNTLVATCAATVSLDHRGRFVQGKPSMLGAVSGAIADLVVITPACGLRWETDGRAIIMGLLGGIVCYWGVNGLKRMLGVDDSLGIVRRAWRRRHPRRAAHRCLPPPELGSCRHLGLRRQCAGYLRR